MKSMVKNLTAAMLLALSSNAGAAELQILAPESPPTNYTLQGEFTGTTVDIVNKIQEGFGSSIEIDVMPWARAYNTAKTTPNVILFTAAKTQEREELGFDFIGPVITRAHTLYAKKGSGLKVESIDDLISQGLTLGTVNGDWRETFFQEAGVSVDSVKSDELNIKKLLGGRIDLWVASDIKAPASLSAQGASYSDVEPVFVFRESSSYILLSKGTDPSVGKAWKDAYANLQNSDFFEETSKKWSETLGLAFTFSPERGLYVQQ